MGWHGYVAISGRAESAKESLLTRLIARLARGAVPIDGCPCEDSEPRPVAPVGQQSEMPAHEPVRWGNFR